MRREKCQIGAKKSAKRARKSATSNEKKRQKSAKKGAKVERQKRGMMTSLRPEFNPNLTNYNQLHGTQFNSKFESECINVCAYLVLGDLYQFTSLQIPNSELTPDNHQSHQIQQSGTCAPTY